MRCAPKNIWLSGSSTGFARVIHRISTVTIRFTRMRSLIACLVALLILASPSVARAAGDATLFRIFLRDGSTVVSYGEFARVGDEVVFSMPVGGPVDDPRLHVVSLPTSTIDWSRTDRYAASARYQQYAQTRGEDDFQLLSSDIARVLNRPEFCAAGPADAGGLAGRALRLPGTRRPRSGIAPRRSDF